MHYSETELLRKGENTVLALRCLRQRVIAFCSGGRYYKTHITDLWQMSQTHNVRVQIRVASTRPLTHSFQTALRIQSSEENKKICTTAPNTADPKGLRC